MIKKFNTYNEGVRDKMTPKPKVEIEERINRLDVDFVPFKDIIKACSGVYDSESIRRINDHSFRYTFRASGLVYTVSCFRLDTYEKGYYKMKLAVTEGRHRPSRVVDIHGVEDVLRIVDRGKEFMRGLNESVRDRMTGKSEEDIMKSIEKYLNRFSKLGTFDYRKYGLAFTDGDLNTNTYKMVDREGNEWFMRLEHYSGDKGRITIYAPPNKLLRVHANERFYSYSELEDYLDKIYGLNESVRDKMTPVSSEEVARKLGEMNGSELVSHITDLINQRNNDLLSIILKNVDMSKLSDYDVYDIIEYCVELRMSRKVVGLLLNKNLSQALLSKLHDHALQHGANIIADCIKERIGVNESVRDRMTPISYEEMIERMDKKNSLDVLYKNSVQQDGLWNDKLYSTLSLLWKRCDEEKRKELEERFPEYISYLKKTNESVRDRMTPKSEEDIMSSVSKMDAVQKLRAGVENGALWLVKQAVEEGVDIHMCFGFGERDSALIRSSHLGHLAMVKYLVEKGADVQADRNRPLQYAVMNNDLDMIKFLLHSGASLKNMHIDIFTFARLHASDDVFRFLGKYNKEKINESVRDKMTPKSDEDVRSVFPPIVDEVTGLLKGRVKNFDIGLDQLYSDAYIEIYFEIGKFAYQLEIFRPEELNHRYRLSSATGSNWKTVFVSNYSDSMVNYIKGLLPSNESVRDKMTPTSVGDIISRISGMKSGELYKLVWRTALYEDWDTMKVLLDNNVDINMKNNNSETLLTDFVRTNDYTIVKVLLDLGADPNIGNDNGYTPLMIATFNDTTPIVELLLSSDKLNPMKHDQLNAALRIARDKFPYVEKILVNHKNGLVSEGVRDKMTPKSEDDINRSIIQTMNDYDNSGTIYPESSDYNDFQHIADLFDESVDNLFVITELDDKWEVINGYLSKLVREDDNYILFDELDGKPIGGEWFCYPDRKIAFFKNRPGQHTLHLWAYCKPFEQTLNEGIRDKMTPKTKEDMVPIIIDKILNEYTEKSVCFVNTQNGPRILLDANTNIMDRVSNRFGNGIYVTILNSKYYTEFKEFFWKRNIAFSVVTADTYKINSHDKIRTVLDKLVEDVFNNSNHNFIVQKFTDLMR